jgi:hypothetical protein
MERDRATIALGWQVPGGFPLVVGTEEMPYSFRPLSLTLVWSFVGVFDPASGENILCTPFFAQSPDAWRNGNFMPNDFRFFFDDSSFYNGSASQVISVPLLVPITIPAPSFDIPRYHAFGISVGNSTSKDIILSAILHVEVIESE